MTATTSECLHESGGEADDAAGRGGKVVAHGPR
jgi:hypothetical protein